VNTSGHRLCNNPCHKEKRKEKKDLQCPRREDALWLATAERKMGAGKRRSLALRREERHLYLYIVASIELALN
jgi:hypothetical protein